MYKFILVVFVLLGAAWYHLSGGSAYKPGPHGLRIFAEPHAPASETVPDVARSPVSTPVEALRLVRASGSE